ncbi:MAG: hypothetical protein NTZ84_00690 [Candidatus Nealsonbacteria bacterium]|nr:hypothetical protein [Candidatus Nealsonbacteria bacterium]
MEIIPKEVPKIPPWLDILFYLSVGFLIFVFISYFLVIQSIKASQKNQEEIVASLASEVSKSSELKKEILTYQKKINDFSSVINGHPETLSVFDFIEKQCHPRVWFNDFGLNINEGKVILSGTAKSFQDLGQQMLIFRDEKMIKSASLDSVTMEKGGEVGFKVSLSFDPSIFIFK